MRNHGVTFEIQKLIQHWDELLHKLKRMFTYDTEYLYKKFRSRVVSEIRSSKIDYYSHYFVEHQSSMKMLWTGIRSIINIKSKQFYNISQLVQMVKLFKIQRKLQKFLIIILLILLAKLIREFQEQVNYHWTILVISWKNIYSAEVELIIAQLKK